ncbi:hypothetical protein C922_03318 [Plasmodium inui San Antonio 1]|uniref:Uncharacterized protein n=1 Tax=Plasmodium inui San Antonio 1 TaxID=1237626 RepID=W6ZZP6_9APIC|nr:hypothetical protein C922_03318 [Plasmodium inui San Antonio 1]EUD66402.1 hypothetical protein C922_03318 [Plasmodium inui San Antonio 1]
MTDNIFKFNDYMRNIRKKEPTRSPCTQSPDLVRTLCDINAGKQPFQSPGEIEDPLIIRSADAQLTQVINSRKKFCLGLQLWASNLEITKGGGKNLLQEKNCRANDTRYGIGGGAGSGTCIQHAETGIWEKWRKEKITSLREKSVKNLVACMDIVEMIIDSFHIAPGKSSLMQEAELSSKGCEKLANRLDNWSNPKVRNEIMRQWFSSEQEGTWQYNNYQLGGKDFFEFLQELVYGDGKAHKNVYCARKGTRNADGTECEGDWCTIVKANSVSLAAGGGETEGPDITGPAGEGTAKVKGQEQSMTDKELATPTVAEAGDDGQRTLGGTGPEASKETGLTPGPRKDLMGGQETSQGSSIWAPLMGGGVAMILGILSVYGVYRIYYRGEAKRLGGYGRSRRNGNNPKRLGGGTPRNIKLKHF